MIYIRKVILKLSLVIHQYRRKNQPSEFVHSGGNTEWVHPVSEGLHLASFLWNYKINVTSTLLMTIYVFIKKIIIKLYALVMTIEN